MTHASRGSDHAETVATAMVFSHPTAGEDAARAKVPGDAGDVAHNVVFSTQATDDGEQRGA